MKVVVVSPTLVPGLIQASEDLKEERRLDLDLRVYYPHQIDDEEIDPDEFGAELRSADIEFGRLYEIRASLVLERLYVQRFGTRDF
jgi:hypothetical protein